MIDHKLHGLPVRSEKNGTCSYKQTSIGNVHAPICTILYTDCPTKEKTDVNLGFTHKIYSILEKTYNTQDTLKNKKLHRHSWSDCVFFLSKSILV